MSLPNHYPLNFPYDGTQYLEALVQDYLELMGDVVTESQPNTLLIEYNNGQSQPHQNMEDSTRTHE